MSATVTDISYRFTPPPEADAKSHLIDAQNSVCTINAATLQQNANTKSQDIRTRLSLLAFELLETDGATATINALNSLITQVEFDSAERGQPLHSDDLRFPNRPYPSE